MFSLYEPQFGCVEGCDTFRINRLMFLALQCWIGSCDECMETMPLISWWPRNITTAFARLGNIRYVVKVCSSWLCSLMILRIWPGVNPTFFWQTKLVHQFFKHFRTTKITIQNWIGSTQVAGLYCAWGQSEKLNRIRTIVCRQFRVLSLWTDKLYVTKMCESWTDVEILMQ